MATYTSNTFSVTVSEGFTPEAGFGLSGTIADGNTLTVTGTNFGTKPNGATPWIYFEFGENSATAGTHSRGTWTGSWDTTAALQTTIKSPNRTHAMKWPLSDGGFMLDSSSSFEWNSGNTKDESYLFNRYLIDASGTEMYAEDASYNIKQCRMWNSNVGSGNNAWFDSHFTTNTVNSNAQDFIANSGDPNANGDYKTPSIWGIHKDQWDTFEWALKQSSIDTQDGESYVYKNAFAQESYEGALCITRSTANSEYYQKLFLTQASNSELLTSNIYYDFVYFDDSRCRIVVSDEPTWNAATAGNYYEREPQIPLTWSDTSLSFEARTGVHGTLSGKYLYVVDSSSVAQKIGQFT